LYALAARPIFETLETFFAEAQGIPVSEFSASLYHLFDDEAVRHLFRVSAGLDSVVIGEPQILGQVADAYAAARRQGAIGKVLSRLFEAAIHAGKRARAETNISHNPASVASVAVNLISETAPDLPSARILVVGAGEMAELAVEALRKRGARHILVLSRTLKSAQELARRWNGQAGSLERLPEYLPKVDVVIASTGAPHTIIHREMAADALARRPDRPMVFMDIAVPRDVEPEVAHLPGVRLFDMDALARSLASSLAQRQSQIPRVEAILDEEQQAFNEYLATLDVVPLIAEIRKRADGIRQDEVEKTIWRMPDLTPEMERQIEVLTAAIVKKILHSPITRLREESGGPNAADYARMTRYLFGLDQ
jgi:glutamyl-tRNA reductase